MEAPTRLLARVDAKGAGLVRGAACMAVGRAMAMECVCMVPDPARTAVASKTARRCLNITPHCSVTRRS